MYDNKSLSETHETLHRGYITGTLLSTFNNDNTTTCKITSLYMYQMLIECNTAHTS